MQAYSTLKIALVVKGKVQEESSGDDVDISSELILTVPLSKKAIEGKINIENNALKGNIQWFRVMKDANFIIDAI